MNSELREHGTGRSGMSVKSAVRGGLGRGTDVMPSRGSTLRGLPAIIPGVGICAFVALLAKVVSSGYPVAGSPVLGLTLGFLLANARPLPPALNPGIAFTASQLLRATVVLLGAGISFRQAVQISGSTVWVIVGTMAVTLVTTTVVGRIFKVPSRLSILLGVGTAVCGASAVAATAPIIRARQEETSYALATIFALNLLGLLAYPILGHALGLSSVDFGTWIGTSIHDTSSVVAAGYSFSDTAGMQATVVKLTRTLFLVPIVLALSLLNTVRERHDRALPKLSRMIPGFVFGFAFLSMANSAGAIPDYARSLLGDVTSFLITMALSAIGLQTRLANFYGIGSSPFLLGLVASLIVAVWSLGWVLVLH